MFGQQPLAKVIRAWAPRFWAGVEVRQEMINGAPAAVLRRDGSVFAVVAIDASAAGIGQVWWLLNPGKLAALN